MQKFIFFLLILLQYHVSVFAETSMSIRDPGNTAVINIDGFSLEGTTGEITVLLPDDTHTSLFTTTNYGNTVFLDLTTYAVRVCTMESLSIDSEGRVSYTAKPGVPCLADSANTVNVCDTERVLLMDKYIRSNEDYVCEAYISITSINYHAEGGSTTTLISPSITLSPGFVVRGGATFRALSSN